MILYPAIDIMGGAAVRLKKGEFDAKKVYDEEPLSAARRWVGEGADHLHVVDLDGAREGYPQNLEHLSRIVKEFGVPVQFGGGLRFLKAIEDVFAAGADRVILGTAAFTDPQLLDGLLGHGPAGSSYQWTYAAGGFPPTDGRRPSTVTPRTSSQDSTIEE